MTDLFDFKPRAKDYAVVGNPIAHSKSPIIHAMFGAQTGIDLNYDPVQVDPGGFQQAVSHFAAHGGAGLNITVPFKVEAWSLCNGAGNELSDRAMEAGSVNTLTFTDRGSIQGDNTDGIGIVRDIRDNQQTPITGTRILMIGAGGAVRGCLGPILGCKPASLDVVNRTASKAGAMAERFRSLGYHTINGGGMEAADERYDLVINGTAASLSASLPDLSPHSIGEQTLVYDMMYSNEPTLFMKWALDQGAARAIDGLGMLVEQAAESFHIWHGVRPDTTPVIDHLRKV